MKKRNLSRHNSSQSEFLKLTQSPQPTKLVKERIAYKYRYHTELLQKRSALQKELKEALYMANWKNFTSIYDEPSPSQIFGQIVKSCGIEGLLYSSVRARNKPGCCLALFLENFEDSDSFVEVIDSDIDKKRIDCNTFKDFF